MNVCTRKENVQINCIHQGVLKILYRDDIFSHEQLLEKIVPLWWTECNIQIFKAKNNIEPSLLKEICVCDRQYNVLTLRWPDTKIEYRFGKAHNKHSSFW